MRNYDYDISEIINDNYSQLSDLIFLLGKVNGQLIQYPYKQLLQQVILVDEIRCLFAMELNDYSYEEVICAIYSQLDSDIKLKYQTIMEGQQMIAKTDAEYRLVPASDFFRMHNSLSDNEITIMNITDNEFSKLLTELYTAESKVDKLAHLLKIFCKSSSGDMRYDLHPICKNVLIGYLLENEFNVAGYGIAREVLKAENTKVGTECVVSHTIDLIIDIVFMKGYLLVEVKKEIDLLLDSIKQNAPKLYNDKLLNILSNDIVLTNGLIEKELDVSPKTAIGYLKKLEETAIVGSYKNGREKFYINKAILNVLNSL